MPQKRVTIAQISDLHINRRVKQPIKDMLLRVLQKTHPDVLIISGDLANQPVWWQMKKAARLVKDIQDACAPIRTIVIPGNHDYKFWGNVGLRRLSRIAFEIYFRRDGLNQGLWWHLKERFRLTLNALWWRGQAMREPAFVDLFPDHPEWGLAVFAINSTSLAEMMAAGRVESHDLQQLYLRVDEASRDPGFTFFYKVALVHHHPAPIADAPSDGLARIQDSFMIFYNAGLFIRELSRRGFNLVLHGHKHVAGFLRVACEFEDQGRTVLPIAAAGTASHPAPDDTRGHHLRIIDIFDDDTARLHERFFSDDVEEKAESYSLDLESIEDVRRRRFVVFSRLRGYSARHVVKNVRITADGYTQVEIKELDCRVVGSASVRRIPLSLTSGRPSYVRGVMRSDDSSAYVRISFSKTQLHDIAGEISLEKDWTREDGPFHFGYSYRLMNGHVLTPQEFARHYGSSGESSEFASITCDGGCDLMTLNVQFPPNYDLKVLEFRATAEYVRAPLTGINDDRLDRGDVTPHDKEIARIGGSIRPEANGYVFTCPEPVPGMIYKLTWKFRELVGDPKQRLSVAAAFHATRQRLLEVAMNASTTAAAEFEKVRSILRDLASDIDSTIAGPPEQLSVSVMVFDESCQRLKFVGTSGKKLTSANFFSGESCAGFAFEKARYILYHAAKDRIGYFIHSEEWQDPKQLATPVVLACFPWFYGPENDGRKLVAGVVNVSTMVLTTKLLGLFDDPELERGVKMKRLQDLANLAAMRLISV